MAIHTQRMRVLIADDDPTILAALTVVGKAQGWETTTVTSGSRFRALLHDEVTPDDVDLILMDHLMPGLNGAELIEWLRETEEWSSIPVVMVTGDPERPSAVQAARHPKVAIVGKPVSISRLRDAIDQVSG